MFNLIVPFFVKIIGYDEKSYKYLCTSKEKFFEPKELIKLLESFGFKLVKQKNYFFGAISVQIMEK